MDGTVEYLWLRPGAEPPERDRRPLRAIVAVESAVDANWRALLSQWLVRSGCRYMMAWGTECSHWDDAVDLASLDDPDAGFVITTWHEHETLAEVFAFCAIAQHPALELRHTLLLHVAEIADPQRILAVLPVMGGPRG